MVIGCYWQACALRMAHSIEECPFAETPSQSQENTCCHLYDIYMSWDRHSCQIGYVCHGTLSVRCLQVPAEVKFCSEGRASENATAAAAEVHIGLRISESGFVREGSRNLGGT